MLSIFIVAQKDAAKVGTPPAAPTPFSLRTSFSSKNIPLTAVRRGALIVENLPIFHGNISRERV
jgi:hypothetical protein